MPVWRMRSVDDRAVERLACEASIPLPLACILAGRGIDTVAALRAFLRPRIADLHDPYLMDGMDRAVDRLLLARRRHEKVLLFGDYDVDGIASTAAMGRVLESMGLRYAFCHPDRSSEGYGFNRRGARLAAEHGCSLIVTLDCGTESRAPIAEAAELGIDTIVIDHHLQKGELPEAAVVNPKKETCPYPFEGLVSAALVLKCARALVEKAPVAIPWSDLLQLAALATVADVASLREENRIIAMLGLEAINRSPLPGVTALVRSSGLRARTLGAGHLAFQIGPRLNAAGRIGSPALATQLLLESDLARCDALARELGRLNSRRQSIERSILDEALAQIDRMEGAGRDRVLVVAGDDWHRGVVGIVAARLLERYYRPSIVIALDGEMGHGSARSIPEFDLFGGLSRCGDLFTAFGGHRHAAGLSLPAANVPRLRQMINAVAEETLAEEDLTPKIPIDAFARLDEIDYDLVKRIEELEPFGRGNPRPVLATAGLMVVQGPRLVGRNGVHVKMNVAPAGGGGPVMECVGWDMADRMPDISRGPIDIAYSPQVNEWNGIERVQLVIRDIRPHENAGP